MVDLKKINPPSLLRLKLPQIVHFGPHSQFNGEAVLAKLLLYWCSVIQCDDYWVYPDISYFIWLQYPWYHYSNFRLIMQWYAMINIQSNSSCEPACHVEWALGFPNSSHSTGSRIKMIKRSMTDLRSAVPWRWRCLAVCHDVLSLVIWKGQMPPNAKCWRENYDTPRNCLGFPSGSYDLKSGKSVATRPAFEDSRSTLRPWGVMDSAREPSVGHFSRKSEDGTERYPFTCGKGYVYCQNIHLCPPPLTVSLIGQGTSMNFQSIAWKCHCQIALS